MTRQSLHALTILWLGAALVAGCNAEVIDGGDEDDEPILLGGGAGGPESPQCEPPPEYCNGIIVTDEDGCQTCEQTSCADCGAGESCVTCNSAVGSTHSCVVDEEPSAEQFACKWIACDVGDVCLDTQPAGDGCPDAACAPVPVDCESDPTCGCLEAAFGAYGCSEDQDGNVTVTGYFSF